jgi:type II secretory ATPase GspE/PulE/Tfp pilus assembly ATPase PilB-like protein
VKLTKGAGCEQCNHTGYYGRIGIFEVLMVTPEINKLILRHASASDINIQATKEGMVSMRQDGYMKVLAGLTTPEEVMRLTQL